VPTAVGRDASWPSPTPTQIQPVVPRA
jgi:hypothetical protein